MVCATGETIVSDLRFIIKYTPTRIFIYDLLYILTVRETDEACSFCARRSHRVCRSAWHLDGTHFIIIYHLSVICVFCVFPYSHTHTCIHTHTHTHTHTDTHLRMYTHKTHAYTKPYTHTQVHMYARTPTCFAKYLIVEACL